MNEFINELKLAGAENVDYSTRNGCDKHDSLAFDLNNKLFYITTLRGGNISGGSFLDMCVLDVIDYDERRSNDTWSDEQWAEHGNKIYLSSLNRLVEQINENNKILGLNEIEIVNKE